jgi:MoaA/NifB/PqqE/SkfB family radical SAM enzyme
MKKTVSFLKNSKNIFFHILTNCNLKCKHCYINKKQHGSNMLSLTIVKSWLSVFSKICTESNLIFLGGEPTLHPDLAQMIKFANTMQFKSITIDTNGYLFNDIILRVEPSEINYISFSLDGATQKTNDNIRGNGSFNKCIEGINKAVSKGFKTNLIYTVSNLNINELDMMVNLVLKLKIDRFFIQVIGIRGNSAKNQKNNLQVSKKEWNEIIPKIAEKICNNGITVTYPKIYLEPDELFECGGKVSDNYFIFPNGRVYKCPLCEDYPIHSLAFDNNSIVNTKKINEKDFFNLDISEGCVMNKIIQPDNIEYNDDGTPKFKVACCLLKEEINS